MMKNIFQHSETRGSRYHLEIVETEITDWQSRHNSPSHLSAPESLSHRSNSNWGKIDSAPKSCRLNLEIGDKMNAAVSILRYQLSDRTVRAKHLASIQAKLGHRLQVAKSQGDAELIGILQAENKQLETSV